MSKETKQYEWERPLKECSYASPAEFLYFYVLRGCGCGSGDKLAEMAWEVFELFEKKSEERWNVIYGAEGNGKEALAYEAMAQWIDSKGLLEHGSSIAGSWLSEEGEKLYSAITAKPQSDEPENGVHKVSIGMP